MLSKPLKGIRVIDWTTDGAAPSACRVLADWGADVIKIETLKGDVTRTNGYLDVPHGGGTGPVWEMFNANKRAMSVDIKTEEGKKIVDRLLESADVFLSNNRYGSLKRNGLDYDTMSAKHPHIVWAHLSGYGLKGPDCEEPGYDTVSFWARGGLMLDCVEKDESVMVTPIAVADLLAGQILAGGVAAALCQKKETGKGDKVLISLYGVAVWAMGYMNIAVQGSQVFPTSRKNGSPHNNTYQCRDGKWMQLSMFDYEKHFPNFCKLLELEYMTEDPRYNNLEGARKNAKEMISIIDERMLRKDRDEWSELFKSYDIPHSVAKHIDEMRTDPQAVENGYIYPVKNSLGEFMLSAPPVQIGDICAPEHHLAPLLGEHTEEIMMEYGFSEREIQELKEKRVIG